MKTSLTRFLTIAYLVLFAIVAFLYFAPAAESDYITQDEIHISGAVIRLTPSGVNVLSDSSHTPVGVESVAVHPNGYVQVIRSGELNNVITTSVTTDETLARLDIEVGLSGGGHISNIVFYRNGKMLDLANPTTYASVASATTNLWFLVVSQ